MKNIASKKALEIISGEVQYHRDLGYDQPQSAVDTAAEPVAPGPSETRSLIGMLASVFLYRLLSAMLILAGVICLMAALAHVHADSIARSYPMAAPHLDVLATIVEGVMGSRLE